MTETLTGKQVLALLVQDEVPEIEQRYGNGEWKKAVPASWCVADLLTTPASFRIKPTPARRLSVTLANGEVVSWPEPVREALKEGTRYWVVEGGGETILAHWDGDTVDDDQLAFGNVHLTREAAQEHADALRKINTQEVGKC